MRKRRVLIHSIAFNPDGVSTAYLYGDIASSLKEHGFEVVVLTTTPHYNRVEEQIRRQPRHWIIPGLLQKSIYKGIPVYHVPQKKFKSTLLRLCGFMYWHVVSFFTALLMRKVDVILSPSPPLTIGLLNIWIGKLKRAKVVYNVQEVYPDILGKTSGAAFKLMSRMEHYIYDKSAAVTTIDKIFHHTIKGRFRNPEKLHIIPNFVDTDIYRPITATPDLNPEIFVKNEHLKLLYAGNIGMAQDWDTLIELAKLTKDLPIDYYVIGEGKLHGFLEDSIARLNLTNIRLLPYQPREMMPQIIAFSDIQFIFMEPRIAAQGFPSKVYTIMASGKPLLICSPENTPIVNFLRDPDCAKIITATDAKEKAREAATWLRSVDADELKRLGSNGLKVIGDRYSKSAVTELYAQLIKCIIENA